MSAYVNSITITLSNIVKIFLNFLLILWLAIFPVHMHSV